MLYLILILILLVIFLATSIVVLGVRLHNVLLYVRRLKKIIKRLEGETANEAEDSTS